MIEMRESDDEVQGDLMGIINALTLSETMDFVGIPDPEAAAKACKQQSKLPN